MTIALLKDHDELLMDRLNVATDVSRKILLWRYS